MFGKKSTQGAEEQTGIPAELDSALRMASAHLLARLLVRG
jgi:hypothetical protein